MKILLVLLIFCFFEFIHTISLEDFRINESKNEKLSLYTHLYYGISNKKSGYYWVENNQLVSSINPKNASHWMKLKYINDTINYMMFTKPDQTYYNIEKVDENYYRIIESFGNECEQKAMTDGQYLDGKEHIAACCVDIGCGNNFTDEYQWKFTVMPDYKLYAKMTDFQYETPLQQIMNKRIKIVDLFPNSTITNDSPDKLTKVLMNEVIMDQSFELKFSYSIAEKLQFFNDYSINPEVRGSLFGFRASGRETNEFRVQYGENDTYTTNRFQQVRNKVTYNIRKLVEVPPHEKLQVYSYIEWMDNLSFPYKAKLTVTGVAPQFESDSRLDSDTISVLLSKYGFNETLIGRTNTSITFEVRGIYTGSYGLDPYYSGKSLGKIP